MTSQLFNCICSVDPTPPYVHPTTKRGRDTHICAGAWIGPGCWIGSNVFIGPYTQAVGDNYIDSNTRIGPFNLLAKYAFIEELVSIAAGGLLGEGSVMGARSRGDNFIHLMAGARVFEGARVHNFGLVHADENVRAGTERLGVRMPRGRRIKVVQQGLSAIRKALRSGTLPADDQQLLQRSWVVTPSL